jgi:hypothetical protein
VRSILFRKIKIDALAKHKGILNFPSEHLLFSVQNSKGKLRMNWYTQKKDEPPYEDHYAALLLNNTPLVRAQSSGCPTCESFLAAGYGLPEDSVEIIEAAKALSRSYGGLEDALTRLEPVVGLLQPGLYILSYSEYFPTNGDGRFFWDVPEDMTPYRATAELYDKENYRVLPCFPCFLYPSQSVQKYDPSRVTYYRDSIRAGEMLPPVLAYHIWGYMSVLLDGHHRACACALEGVGVPCLTLSQPGRIWREGIPNIVWPDNSETGMWELLSLKLQKLYEHQVVGEWRKPLRPIDNPIKFPHPWPLEYVKAVHRYPTCWEAGCLALYPQTKLNEEGLRRLAQEDDYEEAYTAAGLLAYAARQPETDVKKLAMKFTGQENPDPLRCTAFEILDQIKDDPEIDDLMIQILVNCERKNDTIYRIADGHWDKK